MENPLEIPAPEDPVEKIHDLARDIAYGAVHKMWTSYFSVTRANDQGIIQDSGLNDGLRKKWQEYHNNYAIPLLASFGYLVRNDTNYPGDAYYQVTPKAFALLEKQAKTPSIFISHKQDQSSVFALLIEARLKLQDSDIGVFIDRDIPPGEKWNGFLEDRVKES